MSVSAARMNDLLCDDLQWILSPQESEIDELLSQALDAFEASQVQETESHVDTVTPTFCTPCVAAHVVSAALQNRSQTRK